MTLKLITCTLILLNAATCRQMAADNEEDTQNIPYHQNDRFAHDALGFPVTAENMEEHYKRLKARTEPIPNQHVPGRVDTIYELSAGKTKFMIYRAQHRDMLLSAHIETRRIALKNGIRTGMSRSDFEKAMGIKMETDRVRVGDHENTAVWTFHFKRDKLNSIEFSGYVD